MIAVAVIGTAPPPGLTAQVAATMDLGVSGVHYDGFLPSTAVSASPALRYERPQLFILAGGTYLQFESGNHSLQGNLTASAFTPAFGHFRGELLTNIGASTYADFASFSHALIGPRVHWAGDRQGTWVTGSLGTTSYGAGQRPVTTAALGAWVQRIAATWLLTGTYNQVGDTTYTDLEGALHAQRWRVTFDGLLGVRGWSHGGGHGVYGEASAALALLDHLAFVVSGGRYPTDPIWGSVSGRYFGVAFRLTALPWRTSAPLPPPPRAPPHGTTPATAFGGATTGGRGPYDEPPTGGGSVQVRPCLCEGRILVIFTGPAATVEVTGDFTDWEPVSLVPGSGAGEWTTTLSLGPGTYRFNIRINGGVWTVPDGVTALRDDFEGLVGLLTVP